MLRLPRLSLLLSTALALSACGSREPLEDAPPALPAAAAAIPSAAPGARGAHFDAPASTRPSPHRTKPPASPGKPPMDELENPFDVELPEQPEGAEEGGGAKPRPKPNTGIEL